MMFQPGAIDLVLDERLQAGDFYRDSHREIFGAVMDLYSRKEPADPITVTEQLTLKGVLAQVGGKEYIYTLVSTVPAAAHAAQYARIVRENAILRSLIDVGNKIAALGYERPGEVRELLDLAESSVFDISQAQIKGGFRSLEELVSEQFERIEKLAAAGKTITGVPTGFPDLDDKTSGLQPSNLIVLAARPAMGKTAMALDLAQNVALKENTPVAIFSLEMSATDLVQRMMCTQGRVDSHRLRTGKVGADDWPKITEACTRLQQGAPIFVDDTPNINTLEIRSKTRRLKSQHPGLGLIIVDYLQLVMHDGRAENRVQEVSKMSRSLKLLARELEMPVIAISQLSRQVEQRQPPRPKLPDLRESGSIEQDADLVLFIYRPQDESGHLKSSTELIIAKHRNGPTATIHLEFQDTYTSFRSQAQQYRQQ